MKIRNGFVSNSSSSSFMINGGDINKISMAMMEIIIDEFEDGLYMEKRELAKNKKTHSLWIKNLKTALKRKDVKNGKIGITMPSCNYDTYLLVKDDFLYITTCNNHQWSFNEINYEDSKEDEKIYSIVRAGYFYNVRNKKVHSYEFYEPEESKSQCPSCKHYYGNYIMDQKGNRICGSCFKGKLGPTEEANMEKLRKNGVKNPITSLELEE